MIKYSNNKDRILRNIRINKRSGCWEWQLSTYVKGYGQLSVQGDKWLAHRYSFFIFVGEIPKGLCVCHTCDNPSCVNPEHLWLGTYKENTEDMIKKGRHSFYLNKTGERHPFSKITDREAIEICNLVNLGNSHISVANMFGLSRTHVSQMVFGKKRKNAKENFEKNGETTKG